MLLVVCVSAALDYKFVVNSADPDKAISPSQKETETDFVPASDGAENMVPEHDENEEEASSLAPPSLAENGTLVNSTGNQESSSLLLSWCRCNKLHKRARPRKEKVASFKDDAMCRPAH